MDIVLKGVAEVWRAPDRHAPEVTSRGDVSGRDVLRRPPLAIVGDEQEASKALEAEDQRLVEGIRGSDRAAFEAMVRKYSTALYHFIASRVESPSVAEDLVQDLLFNIWRNREQWQVRQSLRVYLYVAARNATLIHRRHARIVERTAVEAQRNGTTPAMGSPGGAADRQTELAELATAVQQAIARLPDRAQQAALLRLRHELSYAEIAAIMGITVKGVDRLLSRAIASLRDHLARYR